MTTPHAQTPTPPPSPQRRPDDSPFDLNLDAVKAEKDLTPFVVQWGGRRWIFRHLEELSVWGLVEAADAGNNNQAISAVLREALGDEQWEEFRKLPLPAYKLNKLWEKYEQHCGVQPGESQGSTGS